MAGLILNLFGGFEARSSSGIPLALPTRKTQALLAYLATPPAQSHARDKLTALLWGEVPDRQARQNLRQALFHLRRALRAAGADPALLVDRGDAVALHLAAVEVDVVAFEESIRSSDPRELDRALALYRGDLLAGLVVKAPDFEDWLMAERERLRERGLEGLARLVSLLSKAGELDRAIHAAVRLLAMDPLQEAVHRTLMRLYARSGRRDAALRQYQVCLDVLRRELGAEPEKETRRLYHELLLLRGLPEPSRPAAGPTAAAGAPLIARETELEQLRAARLEGWMGKERIVAVLGESGIGKSRLIEELVAESQQAGGTILLGRAYEMENALPLGPWVEMLRRQLTTEDGAELLGALDPVRRMRLAALLPELAGATAPAVSGAENPLPLFEAVLEVLSRIAARRPLVIALEDLHWADETSLRLLAFVARRLGGWPVLVVASVRTEELTGSPILERLLHDLDVDGRLTRVELARLSRAATAALVRGLTRSRGARAIAARLVERTWRLSEGNPFMIVETARALREAPPPRVAGMPALPERVRQVIAGRLERVSERGRTLLAVAAVLGSDADFAALQRASGLDESATAQALEELVRRRILHHAGEAFAFDHQQIRQVAYDRLLPAHRRVLHRAAGEALEALHAGGLDNASDRLAHHFAQAAVPGKAIAYLCRVAAAARRRYALDNAIAALDQALAHVEALPPAEQLRARLDILLRQAFPLSIRGRFLDILAALLPYQDDVAQLDIPALSGPYFFRLGLTSSLLGLHDDARRFAERARDAAARSGDAVTRGRAFYVLAACDFAAGHGRDGVAHGEQAVTHLADTAELLALGQAHWIVALNRYLLGEFGAALEACERMRAVAVRAGDGGLEALGAVASAWTHVTRGTFDDAVADAERGRDRSPSTPLKEVATGLAAFARRLRGEPVDAAAPLARAVEAEARYNRRVISGVVLSDVYLLQRDLARAEDAAEQSGQLAAELKFAWGVAASERARGRAALAAGRLDDAEERLSAALAAFEAMPAPFEAAATRLDLAACARARGDLASADAHATRAQTALAALGLPDWASRYTARENRA